MPLHVLARDAVDDRLIFAMTTENPEYDIAVDVYPDLRLW